VTRVAPSSFNAATTYSYFCIESNQNMPTTHSKVASVQIDDAAIFAIGAWFGAEIKLSPYRKILNATIFVNGCLNHKADLLKFLLPAHEISMRKRSRIELTASPTSICGKDWTTVRTIFSELYQRNEKMQRVEHSPKNMNAKFKTLQEHTRWCLNMYAHLAFLLNMRKTTHRGFIHALF